MPYKLASTGKVIKEGKSWTHPESGITYPSSWNRLSDEEKAALGLVWEEPPAPFDNRFYWAAGVPKELEDRAEFEEDGVTPLLDENGQQVITKGLKTVAIEKVKAQAAGLLQPTDWYFTKEVEAGTVPPTSVKAYRQAVRTKSNEIEAAITACTTLDEFIALHNTPVDAEGNPTGNAPLTDWPSETDTFDYVPDQVSMRQARLALLGAGLLDSVNVAITDPAAQIEWEYAQIVKRQSPLIAALASGLSLTEAQVDDLFRQAEAL